MIEIRYTPPLGDAPARAECEAGERAFRVVGHSCFKRLATLLHWRGHSHREMVCRCIYTGVVHARMRPRNWGLIANDGRVKFGRRAEPRPVLLPRDVNTICDAAGVVGPLASSGNGASTRRPPVRAAASGLSSPNEAGARATYTRRRGR